MDKKPDVVVVGAGIVGATTALCLAQLDINILILDAGKPCKWETSDINPRVSAINIASENVFKHLNVWQEIRTRRLTAFNKMSVWESGACGQIDFAAADIAQPHLGHVIENDVIIKSLQKEIAKRRNITIKFATRITELDRAYESANPSSIRLALSDGQHIDAQLLVAADGAHSFTRELAGLDTRSISYEQKAIVARIRTEYPHENTAWQRFIQTGPLAFLPLQDGSCSIVWSCDNDFADKQMQCTDKEFENSLQMAFESRLGKVNLVGDRNCFPLVHLHAPSYISTRVALAGDAAHVVHPLAGLGANLGILDAACLFDVLQQAKLTNRDLGNERVLRRYQRWRRSENTLALSTLSGFKHVFGSTSKPIRQFAATGMSVINRFAPVKNRFTRYAVGLGDQVPTIAQASRPGL